MKKILLTLLLVAAINFVALAQITTSGISGAVTSDNGETLPGATVVAIHQPSGTQYASITNENGRFMVQGMRTGGPYQISVSFVGYNTQQVNDITLTLGNVVDLNFTLNPSVAELDEVVVVAIKNSVINSKRTGASTNVSNDVVNAVPTISRGLRDFTKLSPLANIAGSGTSFAGTNNRYNQFAIDGLINNDVFGLAGSGTNGGQTGIEPISMDAIEEFQINIAPYDVRQSGFTGGGINAITKSGTNKFRGSAYYYGNNEKLVGQYDATNNNAKAKYPDYKDYMAGFTLGGPIIKNKLFFFVNGEILRSKTPIAYIPGTASSKFTIQEVEDFLAVLNRVAPNYDPGSYLELNDETKSNKLLFKVNWNISNKHKLTVRHSYTYGENTDNSRSATALRFYNNGLFFPSTTNSTGLELNSLLSGKMSNRLLLGYTTVRDNRDPLGDPFPTVMVNLDGGRTITVGSEMSSVANQLDQDILTFTNDLNLYLGKHTLTFGTHNEMYSFYNLFVQNIFGNYAYKNMAQWQTVGLPGEVAPTYYAVGYSFDESDNPMQTKGAADFRAMQLSLYVQDEFQALDKLKLTFGLRADLPIFPDKPEGNEAFNEAYKSQGVATGQVPQTRVLWSPRFGFNLDVFGDKTLQVRGGTGLFTGRVPFVWVSNQFTNNGQVNGTFSVGSSASSANPITNPAGITFNPDPFTQKKAEDYGRNPGRGAINVIDKDFKFPQVFRSNLAVDKALPFGIVGTLEVIYSKTLNNINFINLNRKVDENYTFTGVDTRPRYLSGRVDANYDEIVKLENTNKGYALNYVAQLQKEFNKGFIASVSYAYGESYDLNSGTSSVAYSNWRYVNQVNGLNNLGTTRSNFDMGSRVTGLLSYKKDYLRGLMSTQVSLFYNGQSGQAFSYRYNGDLNNDGTSNDLIFVPAKMSDINLLSYNKTVNGATVAVTPEEQWDALNAYIESDDYLKTRRGKYAERNGARLPFTHRFDLKLLQEFKVDMAGVTNKFQLSIDIMNVGNLLNKEWGEQQFVSNQEHALINYTGIQTGTTQPNYTFTGTSLVNGKPYSISDFGSRWRAQIGLRYIF